MKGCTVNSQVELTRLVTFQHISQSFVTHARYLLTKHGTMTQYSCA